MRICPQGDGVAVWCGMCYSNIRGRAAYRGHLAYRPRIIPSGEGIGMALKKRDAALADSGGVVGIAAGKWGVAYPNLWEFMTSTKYADGSPRVLGSLTVFVDAVCLKACLNDRDSSLVAFASAETMEGLWAALERGLKDDSLDWRRGAGAGQRKKK